MKIKIHFCKGTGILAQLLRMMLMSKYNHVAIEVNGVVYESLWGSGVTRKAPSRFHAGWKSVVTVETSVVNASRVYRFLDNQLGKPYDWRAICAMPFRGSWQKRNAWFCSELAYEAFLVGGGFIPDRLPAHRVTPRDLWVALPPSDKAGCL